MGCLGNKQVQPEQTQANTFSVLCLGIGGCGKSTFVKQMKLIHHENWDDVEIDNYVKIIRSNIVYGLQEAVDQAKRTKADISDLDEASQFVLELRPRAVELSAEDVQRNLIAVFKHKTIQAILDTEQSNSELTVDHLRFYCENLDRIADPQFIPTTRDILMCRQRTAGASATSIYTTNKYFEFTDVGGQKPEQKKWLQIMQEKKYATILFFVAANEFDIMSTDDPERTKMAISRKIFGEVCNSENIGDSPVVLLLNKLDLFHSKLETKKGWKSFKEMFPKYKGEQEDKPALDHVAESFLEVLDPEWKKDGTKVHVHHTCALDTEALKVVWNVIREGIFDVALNRAGYGV